MLIAALVLGAVGAVTGCAALFILMRIGDSLAKWEHQRGAKQSQASPTSGDARK